MAQLYVNGIIDRTGRFGAEADPRLTYTDEGPQFQLIAPRNGNHEIVITQADIDNLIRSKAGVFAAIRVLLETTQTSPEDLDNVY
ncbi:MAG: ASKHA domain-containing protein, partial [Planctomycetota bacterium]